jgi:hypothetical protein
MTKQIFYRRALAYLYVSDSTSALSFYLSVLDICGLWNVVMKKPHGKAKRARNISSFETIMKF